MYLFAIIHIYSWPYVSPTVRIEYLCYTVLYFLRYACTTKDFSPAYKQKSGIASSVYLISFQIPWTVKTLIPSNQLLQVHILQILRALFPTNCSIMTRFLILKLQPEFYLFLNTFDNGIFPFFVQSFVLFKIYYRQIGDVQVHLQRSRANIS